MMIKKIAVICALSLLLSSAGLVYASNNSTPDSSLYQLKGLIEDSVMELTQDKVQTAEWALAFAESRMNMLEDELENGRPDFVEDLLAENEALVRRAEAEINDAPEDQGNLEETIQKVTDAHERRTARLQDIIDNKDIPDVAKEGIAKAMENQENAYQNFLRAMQKAQDALQNGQQEDNGNGGLENGEGNKPGSVPPEENSAEIPVEVPNHGNSNPIQ